MLILASREQDVARPQQLTEQRLILGQVCPRTRRFTPDVFPAPGFYDWDSFFNNKRAVFGNFNQVSMSFESYFIESEHDYELGKTLNKKMAVLGHIDSVSGKFIPKKRGGERVKLASQKLSHIAVSYLDEKFPEIQIVLSPQSLDHDLEALIKGSVLIRGKIDSSQGYFKPFKQQNFSQIAALHGQERILKKDCVLGYIEPMSQLFIEKQGLFQGSSPLEIICRKVLVAHIDPKSP